MPSTHAPGDSQREQMKSAASGQPSNVVLAQARSRRGAAPHLNGSGSPSDVRPGGPPPFLARFRRLFGEFGHDTGQHAKLGVRGLLLTLSSRSGT